MKYIVDMSKASADYDKFVEKSKTLTLINTVALSVAAGTIALMTVISLFAGPTGLFNALLILVGLCVIATYVTTYLLRNPSVSAYFYQATRGGKLLDIKTTPCEYPYIHYEMVEISVEDENGDVRSYKLGKVQKVPNTNYTEQVIHLDHERFYVPYTQENAEPEKVEDTTGEGAPKARNIKGFLPKKK